LQGFQNQPDIELIDKQINYFDIKLVFGQHFCVVRVFVRFEIEFQLLSFVNDEKARYLSDLMLTKPQHVS
jgi:hypothetical protein